MGNLVFAQSPKPISSDAQLTGQVVRDGERVHYASLIANGDGSRPRGARWARPFEI